MPLINIQMKQGRSAEQKRELMQAVTSAVCRTLDIEPKKVRIIIADIKPEDYGSGDNFDSDHLK